LSTLKKDENAYEAVVNKLDDCSLQRKYLCNITGKKSKSNNNKFHTFWFEIIDVLKKMVKDKSKLMLKKALKMEVKTFSFFNEEETLEYWSKELDVFLTKVVNIFIYKESFHTRLNEIEYLVDSDFTCLRFAIRNMVKYESVHNIEFYFIGGFTHLILEDKAKIFFTAYLYDIYDNHMHLFSNLKKMTPETFILSTGMHFSVLWEPNSFKPIEKCACNHDKVHTYKCVNKQISDESLLLDDLLDKIVEQMLSFQEEINNNLNTVNDVPIETVNANNDDHNLDDYIDNHNINDNNSLNLDLDDNIVDDSDNISNMILGNESRKELLVDKNSNSYGDNMTDDDDLNKKRSIEIQERPIYKKQKLIRKGDDNNNDHYVLSQNTFEETLFCAESDEDYNMHSQLEFKLNWIVGMNKAEIPKLIRGNTKHHLKEFFINPENGMKFRYCKLVPKQDFDNLLSIIPSDGWSSYRTVAHIITTLSTIGPNKNRYKAVITMLGDCRLPLKNLCNNNNNTFHTFWFEIIEVLRKMVEDTNGIMIQYALNNVQDIYGFMVDEQSANSWFSKMDDFLAK
jgi:hypothetical protein